MVNKKIKKNLPNSKNVCNFATADRPTEAPVWGLAGRDVSEDAIHLLNYILRKRLSTLILDWLKFLANFSVKVKD